MLSWLRKLLRSDEPAEPEAGCSVGFDDVAVHLREPGGKEQRMRWDHLASVVILTNDQGPFAVDVHWVLTAREGGSSLIVPMGSVGEQELLREMQRRLSGFDNEAVIRAMGSTENASFPVWRVAP